tara:strand:+ start:2178 stop:2558 length:381 start_codon:yes stop_codon:yes gene_type:complete
MNISGIIKLINETKEYGSNGFKKREIVITTQEQYPQNIMVEFIQDRCELLDAFNTGDFVKVDINLRGREWVNKDGETKYFNSIQGWRIEKNQGGVKPEGDPLPPIPDFGTIDDGTSGTSATDDLPF